MKKVYSKNNRERILNFLEKNVNFQFSVLQIHEALTKEGGSQNLTTVYRQLEKLVKSGEVLQFSSEDGNTNFFQINIENCTNHLHVRCAVCGKISHLDCSIVEEFLEHVDNKHHIKINCKNSMLFGVCQICEKTMKKKNNICLSNLCILCFHKISNAYKSFILTGRSKITSVFS